VAKYDWIAIKSEYKKGGISLRDLAKKHNVSYSTLSKRAWKEKWDESRNQFGIKVESKVEEKLVSKKADKIIDRNAKLLSISDMATDVIQEYFKDKHYKRHVVKYKYYDYEGKPDREELTSVELSVADTKAFANMIGSLSKIQAGQRLAEGVSTAEVERIKLEKRKVTAMEKRADEGLGNDLPDDGFMEALENKAKDIWKEGDSTD
jgi:transposase